MCNAWNHAPNCTCGWGGKGSTGGGFTAAFTARGTSSFASWARVKYEESAKAYVNPNAKCPECGASVYFYQSPEGGRVFFDQLGKPWPKHPCTERSRETVHTSIELLTLGTKRYEVRGDWVPFICFSVHPAPLLGPNVFVVEGLYDSRELKLFCHETQLRVRAPYLLKMLDGRGDKFMVTTIIDQAGEPSPIDFIAFRSAAALTKKRVQAYVPKVAKSSEKVQKSGESVGNPPSLPSDMATSQKSSRQTSEAPKKQSSRRTASSLGPTAMEEAFRRATERAAR